jgi:hypothetical protein
VLGQIRPGVTAHGVWRPATRGRPKGLTGPAAAARSDSHTAQVGLALWARRERTGRGHRERCAGRGVVAGS